MRCVTCIRLLLPHYARTDLAGVTNPQLVPLLGQHSLEPLRVPGRFHAHTHGLWQAGVKGPRLFALVLQSPLDQLTGIGIHHRDLLIARVKIASYNPLIARLLSSEPWSSTATKSTRSKGADAVIGSGRSNAAPPAHRNHIRIISSGLTARGIATPMVGWTRSWQTTRSSNSVI